jgi:hypothetical protein
MTHESAADKAIREESEKTSYDRVMARETADLLKHQRVPVSIEEHQSAENLIDRRNDLQRQIGRFNGARDITSPEIASNRSNLERLEAELNKVKDQISKARGDEATESLSTPRTSVKAWEIMLHFNINNLSSDANEKWWHSRMSDAKRYGLLECRDQKGVPGKKNSSTWYPDGIAGWLIDKKHMEARQAANLLRTNFPEYAEAAEMFDPKE